MPSEPLREVGRIGRAHGLRGELYVDLITSRHERLAPGARLQAQGQWLIVAASKQLPKRWLVRFEGIDDRTAADRLVGATLLAESLKISSTDDEWWVHDLIGSRVVDVRGVDHGACVSVVANPAHDLLELDSGALVPIVFVVARAAGIVTIDPPDGLFE